MIRNRQRRLDVVVALFVVLAELQELQRLTVDRVDFNEALMVKIGDGVIVNRPVCLANGFAC
jgi:hypothetical protein